MSPPPEAGHQQGPPREQLPIPLGLSGGNITLTPEQEVAKYLTYGTLLLISLITLALLVDHFFSTPRPPTLASDKSVIENYKTICTQLVENTKQLFEMTVAKVLFPLLTALLGWLFGTRQRS